MKRIFILSVYMMFASVGFLSAQDAKSYYSSIEGVGGGEQLKMALHNLIKKMSTVEYGSGVNATWGAFYTTDFIQGEKRRVADMYSSEIRYFGVKGEAVDGMNIEHCVAKSWWGGAENNAYHDLHHLNPSDQEANSKKSNYPLAKLSSVTWTNGVSSVGKAVIAGTSQNAYEPADCYKGDFARTYMYMFTCYQNLTWKYTWMCYEKSEYPTLKPWAVELLLKWHAQDPVSEKEIARNNAVYAIQGNRNPFIDYPRLADFVWGDSVDFSFHLYGDVEDGSGNQAGSGNVAGGDGDGGSEGGNTGGESLLSPDKYTMVLNAENLTLGDTIIVVYENVAMSTEQRANNRGVAAVEISGNEIVSLSPDVQRIVLESGYSGLGFALNVGNGYLYAASNSNNHLRTQNFIDANASWRIVISADGKAEIAAQGDKARNLLQYNSSADIFSCYKSGQKSVSIYAKAPSSETGVAPMSGGDRIVSVYSISGRCVRRAVPFAEAVKGLSRGVYIVGKEKFVVE